MVDPWLDGYLISDVLATQPLQAVSDSSNVIVLRSSY